MDILTQAALGASVSGLAFSKTKPKHSILLGALIGIIPDLDVFILSYANDYDELVLHRAISHSILFFLLVSLIAPSLLKRIPSFKDFSSSRLAFGVFLILFTHALLDCFTTWGTQLFWPIPLRIASQSFSVIDLFYSISLAIGIYLFLKSSNQKYLIASTMISTLYLLLGISMQGITERKVEKYLEEKFEMTSSQAVFLKPFNYRLVFKNSENFIVSRNRVNAFTNPSDIDFDTIPHNEALLMGLSKSLDLSALISLGRGHLAIRELDENCYEINDLRYGPLVPSNHYHSVFTYYLSVEGADWEFRQELRTKEKLEIVVKDLFKSFGFEIKEDKNQIPDHSCI